MQRACLLTVYRAQWAGVDMIQALQRLWKTLLLPLASGSILAGEEGRAGSDWWSLQPVRKPACPRVEDGALAVNPIDGFILEALRAKGLSPSEAASPRTLVRRVSYDLRGLRPSQHEDGAFEGEVPLNAYERAVDRYLASPHYGQRWARHWLDIARFGESQGFERDKLRTNSWRYRDWVVEALNADMPYDVFVRLQLAGDVLLPGGDDGIIATGFLVAGAYDEVGQSQQSAAMKATVRQEEIEDYVSTVGQAFLGLTVHCARCHNHKFDPITQREYFQLAAALVGVGHGERELSQARSARALAPLEAHLRHLKAGAVGVDQQAEIAHLQSQRQRWQSNLVYAVKPTKPDVVRVLHRGNPSEPRGVVAPGGVAAVQGVKASFGLDEKAPESARRIKLAEWITHDDNPLFARVIVNRLWHYHFGQGLVDNPSDLGFHGGQPSHPALLEWLAGEISKRGWSLKAMHRLMVTSATYRQASLWRREAAKVDTGNQLLWRKSPARLEAEALRDAMLQVAGKLNTDMGGPGYYDFTTFINNTQFYSTIDAVGHSFNRRSLYRTWVRSGRNGFLDAFDCPDPSATAPKRAVTTTPLQSLALMNNAFALRMAGHFAERVRALAGTERPAQVCQAFLLAFDQNSPAPPKQKSAVAQVCQAFLLAFDRDPDQVEVEESVKLIESHGLPALCRVLFNSNEFLYVD